MSIKKEANAPHITNADYKRASRIIRLILEDRELEEAKKDILLAAVERYKFYMQNAYQAQMRYRYLTHVVTILTPILGAAVTAISLIQAQSIVLAILGILVTITSAIDSAYKASHNFEKCAHILIQLNDWVVDFEMDLIDGLENSPAFSKQGLKEFILRKNQELSNIGKEHASIVIPYLSVSGNNAFSSSSYRTNNR